MIAVPKKDMLAELMYRKGWTRRQLAKKAQIGEVTMQQVYNGKRNPSAPVAKKIADALGVDVVDLFNLTPRKDEV